MQAYDLVAGTQGLTMSRFNTRKESHRQFPTLAQTRSEDGTSLKGTVSRPRLMHQGHTLLVFRLRFVECHLKLTILT